MTDKETFLAEWWVLKSPYSTCVKEYVWIPVDAPEYHRVNLIDRGFKFSHQVYLPIGYKS
jgi:hypothetical protein